MYMFHGALLVVPPLLLPQPPDALRLDPEDPDDPFVPSRRSLR